jgi:hypothetical protein
MRVQSRDKDFHVGQNATDMPESEIFMRTLRRAAELVGGEQQLAMELRVTPSHLALWLSGAEQPSIDVFLRAVALIHRREFPQA